MRHTLPAHKTKIVCTIGPASQSREVLEKMIANGMSVARLNFAHGDFKSHHKLIDNIRALASAMGKRVAIMGDLPGPKMRIGRLKEEPIILERGQSFVLQTEEIEGDSQRVYMDFAGLPQAVKMGDKIYVNDGFIQLEVQRALEKEVQCTVLVGGELRSYKGVNLPGIDLGISAFTERDHECLKFASEHGLDAVSQSFVQSPGDILELREAARAMNYHPFLIAKIERSRAVDNLDAILGVVDGIMVARGDLGVEMPIEEIAIVQKHIIKRAQLFSRPVITATHMLESMVIQCRPTRAEVTDVANAILDGTDCVMLSGETAMGNYPAESVAMMSRIACVTEPYARIREVAASLETAKLREEISTDDLISLSIYLSVEVLKPTVVVTPTRSGATPRRISRFRIPVWIIGGSVNNKTCQNLQFSYGVYPVHVADHPSSWDEFTRAWLEKHGLAKDLVILTQGTTRAGGTNQVKILDCNLLSDEMAEEQSQACRE